MWPFIQVVYFFFVTFVSTKSLEKPEPVAFHNMSTHTADVLATKTQGTLQLQEVFYEEKRELFPSGPLNCGVTILSNEGILVHKPFDIANAGERCVWIIRAQNATYVDISLDTFSNIPPASSLSVLGLGTNGTQQSIQPSYTSDTLNTTSVSVVTFVKFGNSDMRGFALRYSFGNNGGNPASSLSKESYPNAVLGTLKHPSSAPTYSNYEVSVLAFVPPGTCTGTQERVRLLINAIKMEEYSDFITVYEFTNYKWVQALRFYDRYEQQMVLSSEMFRLVFTSDGANNYEGFEVTYSIC